MSQILIADDEDRICRFVSRALAAEGHETDVAATAAETVSKAAQRSYALIILDLMLPDRSGYDVLRELVERPYSRRIIILSALSGVESKVRCLRSGAVDYLTKPFAIAELIERVKRRIDEAPSRQEPRWLDAGDVRLDLQRRCLYVKQRLTPLSDKEFVLMSHLMRHADEVCTRGELLASVWGYSFDPGSNVVDVCVRRLRSKLDANVIETVRNVGYCFVPAD